MNSVVNIPFANFDAAIFDMDGTMINNMAYHMKAWLQFAKKYGQELTEEEFKTRFSGKKNDQLFRMFFNKELTNEEIDSFTEDKEAIYREMYTTAIKEVPGLTNVIKTLQKQQKKLAIATTAPKKNRDFGLEALHLEGLFDVILGDEHVTHGKPHPEIYLETAKQLGIDPSRCLVFEDSPPGVAAGKAAGMTVVGMLTTHSEEDLKMADYHVSDFSEIVFI